MLMCMLGGREHGRSATVAHTACERCVHRALRVRLAARDLLIREPHPMQSSTDRRHVHPLAHGQRELGGARLERRSWIIDHAAEEPQVVLSVDDLVGGRRLATSLPRLHVTRGQEALDDLALCLLAELPAQCLSHGCVVLAEDEPLEDDEPAEVLRVRAAPSGRAGRTDRRK